jgi:hypothetical protein
MPASASTAEKTSPIRNRLKKLKLIRTLSLAFFLENVYQLIISKISFGLFVSEARDLLKYQKEIIWLEKYSDISVRP